MNSPHARIRHQQHLRCIFRNLIETFRLKQLLLCLFNGFVYIAIRRSFVVVWYLPLSVNCTFHSPLLAARTLQQQCSFEPLLFK